ncbi:Scr1 family TA system antitoxin-like transcriptional regulator [Streptomyces profundus]|uniref:Scr1 family TA system antitoxin-like transcriptional regulator n=1 Tax=Streptomyces profundus TaxID=2867410 RepID=UPI001D169274|nr:Scr1 family TA system antitoxin-like transcriptional regulator [Streptomyces sp. MA3_2.13]UED85600.1 Scr1 family TA system antitoxin-like transcriptional regulator [Streptomyces sp. MA3_2.13]
MAASSPTARRRRLGSELRNLRRNAGKSLDDAAEVLDCHRSRVSRIETGHLPVKRRDLEDLFNLYSVTDTQIRETLQAMARQLNQPNWWAEYGLDPTYENLLGLESESNYIRSFQSILIPGLLQTNEYTRAVIRANPALVTDEAVEKLLQVRTERKLILTRDEEPIRFWAIIGEAALRTPVGGAEVMRAQVDQLLSMTERPNITVQVLPYQAGAHAGLSGPFIIFQFPLPGERARDRGVHPCLRQSAIVGVESRRFLRTHQRHQEDAVTIERVEPLSSTAGVQWIKSSRSGSTNNCVEVAALAKRTHGVRDSKRTDGPILTFGSASWQAFLTDVGDNDTPR